MFRKISILCLMLCLGVLSSTVDAQQQLKSSQISRAKAAKKLLGRADRESFQQTVDDIMASPSPEGYLQIYEAMANVYQKMIKEYDITDNDDQQRLLGKIRMNMAYYQLGGPDVEREADGLLNIVIRRNLKKTLSPDVFEDRRLFYSLTDE